MRTEPAQPGEPRLGEAVPLPSRARALDGTAAKTPLGCREGFFLDFFAQHQSEFARHLACRGFWSSLFIR